MSALVAIRVLLVLAITIVLTMVIAAVPLQQQTAPVETGSRWYKGNTHTHTLNSDGDSTPDDVVRWYREHGYQFLVLTDHNFVTSVAGLNALHGADEQVPGDQGRGGLRSLRGQVAPHQRARRQCGSGAAGRLVGRRRAAAQRGRDSPGEWDPPHQSSVVPLVHYRAGAAAGP